VPTVSISPEPVNVEGGGLDADYNRVDVDELICDRDVSRPVVPDGLLSELPFPLPHWQDFEKLIVALARDVDDLVDVWRYGASGQVQHGIDIVGFTRHETLPQAYQGKNTKRFGEKDLKSAVNKFAQGRRPFKANRLVVAVTVPVNHAKALEWLHATKQENPGLVIELWDSVRINELLRTRPDIVRIFFGEQATLRFCLPDQAVGPQSQESKPRARNSSGPNPYFAGRYVSGTRAFPVEETSSFLARGDDGGPRPELDHVLSREDLSRLRKILGKLAVSPRPDQVVEIFQAASEFLGTIPPSGDVSLSGYVAQLEQAWTRHRQLPPLLAFLEFLAARSASPDDKKLRKFVRHVARQMDVEKALHKVAEAAAASRDAVLAPIRVVVSAEQDDACSGNYMLTACLHLSTTGLPVKKQTAISCTLRELQCHGELLLDQAGAWLAEIRSGSLLDPGKLQAEFELPMALIDQPVDKWRVGVGNGIDIELGVRCIVLVRPSDYRRGWGIPPDKRWAQLHSGTGQARVRWLHRNRAFRADLNSEDIVLADSKPEQILAKLLNANDVACVALSYAYQPGGEPFSQGRPNEVDGLSIALATGVPVAMWLRDGGDVTSLRTMLDEIAAQGMLSQLPAKVHKLRIDAAQSATDGSPHLGRHLTLLWNPPAHLPGSD
jgi:hypothetical protein